LEEETIEEGSDSESDSSSSSSDSNNEESESVIESNIAAEEDEDFYNLDDVDVPEIMRSQSFTPKIVDEEEKLIPKTEELLGESMKLIDTNVHMQIFCGPSSEERDELNIKRVKQLGGGAQADVYQVRVVGLKGKFVDKTRKIYNNLELAEKTMKEMFAEFTIAKDLVHPNIVKYEYFMRDFQEATQNYEFHILMEMMEGEDMEVYLKEQGKPFDIDRVRQIGG